MHVHWFETARNQIGLCLSGYNSQHAKSSFVVDICESLGAPQRPVHVISSRLYHLVVTVIPGIEMEHFKQN